MAYEPAGGRSPDSPANEDEGAIVVKKTEKIEKLQGTRFMKLIQASAIGDANIEPTLYLAASAELLFMTIVGSLIITWINDLVNDSDVLTNNPIRNMVGYNNPCAFWDQPPALYFAFLMFCPMIYMAIRYAHLDNLRADLTFKTHKRAMACINWLYAISQCLLMGIFVVTPKVPADTVEEKDLSGFHVHMRLHSFFFLQFVPCLMLAMVLSYWEAYTSKIPITTLQKIVVAYFVLTTVLETCFASYAIFTYQGSYKKGEPHHYRVDPILMQVVDYAWFLSLPMVSVAQPAAPNIIITYTLDKEELEDARKSSQ